MKKVACVSVEVDGTRYLMGNRWDGDYFAGGSSVNYYSRKYWDLPNARHYVTYQDGTEETITNEEAHAIIAHWG